MFALPHRFMRIAASWRPIAARPSRVLATRAAVATIFESEIFTMTRTATIAALFAALTIAAPAAMAQDPSPQPAPTDTTTATTAPAKGAWEQLDRNSDGNLSKDESAGAPALEKVFEQADANADGSLTGDEYRAYLAMHTDETGRAKPDKKK
ncbi:MAG: EF-hand domain-containing protein [Lysobacter sp.]|nr:MAG: EF-hand domain-containing protein [Lysobacter sp.]